MTSQSPSSKKVRATQEGEISFCAYNTGVGWRNIIDAVHQREGPPRDRRRRQERQPRSLIIVGKTDSAFADGKEHTLVLKMEDVQKKRQTDLDDAGISKTAREEKVKARDQKAKDAEMMKLYREHVLGEKPLEGFVHLGAIQPAAPVKPAAAKEKEVGSFGD